LVPVTGNRCIVGNTKQIAIYLGLGAHLFVKVPRPGDSEGTFSVIESSSPVTTSLTTQR